MKTCTGSDCPERTGGKCNAGQKIDQKFVNEMIECLCDDLSSLNLAVGIKNIVAIARLERDKEIRNRMTMPKIILKGEYYDGYKECLGDLENVLSSKTTNP